tara:strand:+ start:475 stop:2703 length:2229 start_codon:yes stop_codon:yes gene_type:complete
MTESTEKGRIGIQRIGIQRIGIQRIGIIRYPGSNCDIDTLNYFNTDVSNSFYIWHKEKILPHQLDLLVIPGGFAFGDRIYNKATGDYIISPGTMAIDSPVTNIIMEAAKQKIPILGICNGFQILTQLGLLPGELVLNNYKQFVCKEVNCTVNFNSENYKYNGNTQLYIANSYGKYSIDSKIYKELNKNNQVFLKYGQPLYEIGSFDNIAGVCNKDKTIFGMMPHPERTKHNSGFKEIFMNILFNSDQTQLTSQELFENSINQLMNSEHISYKSTKKYLKLLHTQEPWVVQGPGENAGIVDIGDGYCIALRIESHNHPTFINPFEGSATGVGGIMRDIFTMGARPIAILDFLRFGTDQHSEDLLQKAIKGISYYGNCVGVPNIGGDLYKHENYNKNPLVNVGCIGIVKKENIIYGYAKQGGDLLIYVGSKTGNEGINGAAMASNSFNKTDDMEELEHNVQKGDPFLEKLLLEACCEIAEKKLAVGMQDMGAGGLLCASYEIVMRGCEKTGINMGATINIDKIPTKYSMEPVNILISESQERMLIVCKEEHKNDIFSIFETWDLEYAHIGSVNTTGEYKIQNSSETLFTRTLTNLKDITQEWKLARVPKSLPPQKIKLKKLWEQYDSSVGNRTIKGPESNGSYAILDIYENNTKLILTWDSSCSVCADKIKELGGKPLCLVNCLNYGHPEDSLGNLVDDVTEMTTFTKQNNIPVVGGNVSLYNTTDGNSIPPTPIILMMGLIKV